MQRIRMLAPDGYEWRHGLSTRKDGKRVTFTYKETGPDRAKMTAEVEGSIFTAHLEKSGVTLPLSHANVEKCSRMHCHLAVLWTFQSQE
jgi:hypothetical protein